MGKTETATAALALVEFAGVISADKLLEEIGDEGPPVAPEVDALHQLVALTGASRWLNERVIAEYVEKQRADGAGGAK